MKALTRVPIFSYNSIATTLLIPTKSLEIKFRKTFLNAETLFELESILAWAATHTEVQSLFITSFGEEFIQGFDPEEVKALSEEKLKKQYKKYYINNLIAIFRTHASAPFIAGAP